MQIDITKVVKSYNGKSGCMCGCNGTYTLSSRTTVEEENGYNAFSGTDINDRKVKIAVNKINKELAKVNKDQFPLDTDAVGINDKHAWINDGSRTTVVYFK